MKKRGYFVLTLVFVVTAVLVAIGGASWRRSAAQKPLRIDQPDVDFRQPKLQVSESPAISASASGIELYESTAVLKLEYGDGNHQVGLIVGVEDFRPTGPLSFAVRGEAIYLLDEVNNQVKAFNQGGDLIRAVEVDQGASDIAVDARDRLYVLDSTTNQIAQYEVGSLRATHQAVDQPVTALSVDSKDTVSAKLRNDYSYKVDEWSGKLKRRPSLEAFTCIKVGERAGRVINNSSGKTINLTTENSLGSVSYLGTDRDGNIFIVIEELLPGDAINVRKEVRKYSAAGQQLAAIPVNIDYIAHPEKELILAEDGSVYHLLPLKEHVVIEKWFRRY